MPMDISDRVDRTHKLLELLRELADTAIDYEANIAEYAQRLGEIYGNDDVGAFRHHYSEISNFLYKNLKMSSEGCTTICDALEVINQNIENVNVAKAVEKLIDHVSLEALHIGRFEESVLQADRLNKIAVDAEQALERIKNIQDSQERIDADQKAVERSIQDAKDALGEAQDRYDDLKKRVENQGLESISILSIFAGVVLAFTGGLTVLGGVFSNVKGITGETSYFFVACIAFVGMVMFNVIHMLLWYVGKLVYREHTEAYKPCQWLNRVLLGIMALMMVFYYWQQICDLFYRIKDIICAIKNPAR